jgi:threonine dehydrogenase-like Zn-dependent dehydrogenase
VRITTTICGTEVPILKGEYPVAPGLTVGHEPFSVIEKLGSAVQGYHEGRRVIAGAICPNFNSYAAQDGAPSQDGSYLVASGRCGCHGYKATAGWRFGNIIGVDSNDHRLDIAKKLGADITLNYTRCACSR